MTIGDFSQPTDDMPSGIIIPWFSTDATAPPGWVMCDGNNGTPNLQSRFPRGVPDASTDPGATGGSASVSLSTSQMPSHDHNVSSGSNGSHSHVLGTGSGADGTISRAHYDSSTTTRTTSTSGGHSHPISDNSAGGGSSYDNQPQYLEVNFIKKL